MMNGRQRTRALPARSHLGLARAALLLFLALQLQLLCICMHMPAVRASDSTAPAAARAAATAPAAARGRAISSVVHASATPAHEQAEAVRALVRRLLPAEVAAAFELDVAPHKEEFFEIQAWGGRARVTASGGVALANGVYHYLKYYCDCSVSWGMGINGTNSSWGVDNLAGARLPLPAIANNATVRRNAAVPLRYALNVVTYGYTTVWWDEARWMREIDFMVLHGINLVLAHEGQEALWENVYRKLGLSQAEIEAHFTGPAYLPWMRMGNCHGWAGPLPATWRARSLALQKRIVRRLTSLGMQPALPCFAGHVPRGFANHFNASELTASPCWASLNSSYTCQLMVKASSPLFGRVARAWMLEQDEAYNLSAGVTKYFACDTFNEMTPASAERGYLAQSAAAVSQGVRSLSSTRNAVWVMQAWLFTDQVFWNTTTVGAYLGGVGDDELLILDLSSEDQLYADQFENYFGKAWIWNVIHNSGGIHGVYGDLQQLTNGTTGPLECASRANGGMVGLGYAPEGLETNPALYEALLENGMERAQPMDPRVWAEAYATRRYGDGPGGDELRHAWRVLQSGLYACLDRACGHGKSRPNLEIWRPSAGPPASAYSDTGTSTSAPAAGATVGVAMPQDGVYVDGDPCKHMTGMSCGAYNSSAAFTAWGLLVRGARLRRAASRSAGLRASADGKGRAVQADDGVTAGLRYDLVCRSPSRLWRQRYLGRAHCSWPKVLICGK